jgi:HK97 gp10 family phage protein
MSRFEFYKDGSVSLRWYGDTITKKLRKEINRRLNIAADVVFKHVKATLSVSGSSKRAKQTKRRDYAKGKKLTLRKNARMFGTDVSAPGEAPRKQRGRLYRSVAKQVKNLSARIRVPDQKAHLLEFGTKRMQARPFLRRAVAEKTAAVRQILSGFWGG